MNKFELTSETINHHGFILYRIKALKSFGDVNAGDLGGYVESERNLSQSGKAWVYDNAKVYNKALVDDHAKVRCEAEVYGNARIYDLAEVNDHAKVFDDATVSGNAMVYHHANVYGLSLVRENAHIYGHAQIFAHAHIYGNATISGDAKVFGGASICGFANISGQAKILFNGKIFGDAEIIGDAVIFEKEDYLVFENLYDGRGPITWTRSNNMWCAKDFYGTGEKLIEEAYKISEKNGREYEYIVEYPQSIFMQKYSSISVQNNKKAEKENKINENYKD